MNGRGQMPAHLGVVERVAQIPFEDFVLAGEHVAVLARRRGILLNPVVEIGGADAQAIADRAGLAVGRASR